MLIKINKLLAGALLFCLSISFTSFVSLEKNKTSKPKVEILLDTIAPGPITIKQLYAVKQIRITSTGPDGKTIRYKIKSAVLQMVSIKGYGSGENFFAKIDLKNNVMPLPLSYAFSHAKVGFTISLGALYLEDIGSNYDCIAYPNWGIVAESNAVKK